MNAQPPSSALSGTVALTHWGVIAARGAEAVGFLQGQLTNDVAGMTPAQARLAGFCSAKGRLLASFVVWRGGADEVFLACAASVLPATLKRLSMFVLRARCKLVDASDEVRLWGLAGAAAMADGLDVWHRGDLAGTPAIRLPDAAGQPRALLIGEPSAPLPALALDAWRWLEVQSGVPTIETATVEQFVPQMINYELLGGVDFRKGCYPGQEVVARSQYRGTLKRRTFLFDVEGPAAAGQEIFHSADPGQPAGRVVSAAPKPGSTASSLLAEIKLAALASGSLHLGSAEGARLTRDELPYPVPIEAGEPA